jgi:hypothetical protein
MTRTRFICVVSGSESDNSGGFFINNASFINKSQDGHDE